MASATISNQQINRDIIKSLPVIVLASLLTICMDRFGLLSGFENATTNAFQQLRLLKPDNVFLVTIDEDDYSKIFHGQSPLNPDALSEIIQAIASGKPRAIVVDLDTSDPKFQKLQSLKADMPIIWAAMPPAGALNHSDKFSSSLCALGVPIEQESASSGVAGFPRDTDGIVSRYDRMLQVENKGAKVMIPSLPWSVTRQCGGELDHANNNRVIMRFLETGEQPGSSTHAGTTEQTSDKTIDAEISSGTVLDFYRRKKTAGFRDMLAAHEGRPAKIAVLGGTFRAGRDTYETPIGPLPSVIITACAIETELQHAGIFQPDLGVVFILQIIAGLAFAYISFRYAETIIPLASLIFIPVVAFAVSVASFVSFKLWIDFIPALVVLQMFYSYLHIKRVRKRNVDLQKVNVELVSTKDKLGRALESGAEQERKRVTTEIHDETQDYFSMVKAMIKPLAEAGAGDGKAKKAFDAVSDGLLGLRRIMANLYPPEFDDEDATFLRLLEELAKRKSPQLPTAVQDDTNKTINQLDRANWFPAYRIVQQALANAVTHAQPTSAKINVAAKDGSFIITVTDDGKGIPAGGIDKLVRSGSYGVDSMKARTELLKGTLDWVSPSTILGKGTDVVLTIPMAAQPASERTSP